MELEIPVNNSNYNKAMLMLINIPFNLNLSKMEIDMVACMLDNKTEIITNQFRRILRDELIKDNYTINNYIARLRDKGILITKPADKNLYVNPRIVSLSSSINEGLTIKIVSDGD